MPDCETAQRLSMTQTVNIAVAGAGAFGTKHLEGLAKIPGATVAAVVDPELDKARAAASRFNVPHAFASLSEALALPGVDAVILCTPTPMHARQAIACLQ